MGDSTVPLAIVIYIHGSFIKNKIAVKPIYVTFRNLDYAVVSGMSMAGARYAQFSEEEGHCGSVECLARSAPSQVASCMHETRGGLHQ